MYIYIYIYYITYTLDKKIKIRNNKKKKKYNKRRNIKKDLTYIFDAKMPPRRRPAIG